MTTDPRGGAAGGAVVDGLALEARDLVAGYEPGLHIVRGASLAARPGEVDLPVREINMPMEGRRRP